MSTLPGYAPALRVQPAVHPDVFVTQIYLRIILCVQWYHCLTHLEEAKKVWTGGSPTASLHPLYMGASPSRLSVF